MPLYVINMECGGRMFLCGDLGDHCGDANCGDVSGFLCDFPVADGKTCDMPLCHSSSGGRTAKPSDPASAL